MPPQVLYDLNIRNLTNSQLAAVQNVVFNNVQFEREEINNRPVEVTVTQHPAQIDMWDILFYHLKPNVVLKLQEALFKNKLYPVMYELKG